MYLLVSDNKLIMETLINQYQGEYNYEDFIVLNEQIALAYISTKAFNYNVGGDGSKLFNFEHRGKPVSINAAVKDRDRINFVSQIASSDSTYLVNACSMDREGQLNFYALKYHLGMEDKSYRLFLKDLTPETISQSLTSLVVDEQYDSLAHSYLLEVVSDIVMKHISKKEINYGLTTKQAWITNALESNQEELLLFNLKKYFLLRAKLDNGLSGLISVFKGSEHFKDVTVIAEVENALLDKKLKVTAHNDMDKSKDVPLLFNGFDLTVIAKNKYEMTDIAVMDVAKSLFLKGYITNPKTNGRLLPPSTTFENVHSVILSIVSEGLNERAYDYLNSKYTQEPDMAHLWTTGEAIAYGICPTGNVPNIYELSDKERFFYLEIVDRYFKLLAGPKTIKNIKIKAVYLNEYQITVDEEFILSYGFDVIDMLKKDIELMPSMILEKESHAKTIVIKKSSTVEVIEVTAKESSNRPPKGITQKILLRLMEQSGRKRMSAAEKELYKDYGIGTLVEREKAIKKLLKDGIISYNQDDDTIQLVESVQENLRKGALPSNDALREVYATCVQIQKEGIYFIEAYKHIVRIMTESVKNIKYAEKGNITNYSKVIKYCTCPFCNGPLRENRFTIDCQRCDFKAPKEKAKRQLTTLEMVRLIGTRQSPYMSGFTYKSGKTGSARLLINDDKKTVFDFNN